MEQFIDSPLYKTFIKFARHLMDLRPVDYDRFIDYVFRNIRKDRDWCKDAVYEAYIVDYLSKEPVEKALERSVITMIEWGEKRGEPYNEFLVKVSPSEATHLIQMGKISPWVIFLSQATDDFIDRLSDEQWGMIDSVVNTKVWMTRFQIKKDDCDWAREKLQEANI